MTSAFGGLRSIHLSYECATGRVIAERGARCNEARRTQASNAASAARQGAQDIDDGIDLGESLFERRCAGKLIARADGRLAAFEIDAGDVLKGLDGGVEVQQGLQCVAGKMAEAAVCQSLVGSAAFGSP